jgi:hypothetical protein
VAPSGFDDTDGGEARLGQIFRYAQHLGLTFAIWGPFARQNRAARRMMAHAAPPARYAPRISGELAEAAERYGLTALEAAAYDCLGVSLT